MFQVFYPLPFQGRGNFGGTGFQPVQAQAEACGYIYGVKGLLQDVKSLPDTTVREFNFVKSARSESLFRAWGGGVRGGQVGAGSPRPAPHRPSKSP